MCRDDSMMTALWLVALLVNPVLTPGAVRPLTREQVCAIRWGTDSRHVSPSLKARVFAAYGVPIVERGRYVVDHKIPRALAGADTFENLWPELRASAHFKDVWEVRLHREICKPSPTITLEAAQAWMRAWPLE